MITLPALFFFLAFFTALLEWLAVVRGWRSVEYFAKPGVMIFLLAWLVLSGSLQQANLRWFTAGAFFSLLGDAFLLLRRERLGFMLGLVAFLLAHFSYILALKLPGPSLSFYSLIIALLILALMVWVGRRILSGLRAKGLRKLVLPVAIYVLTLGTMLFCALNTSFRPDWDSLPALWVGLGAFSFALSDGLLAWDKFVSPLRFGRVTIMVTYHLGQFAIMTGAILQFA